MGGSSRMATGPDRALTGLVIIGLCVTILTINTITGAGPLTGRWAAFIVLGIPVGAILVVLGVVKTLRDRR